MHELKIAEHHLLGNCHDSLACPICKARAAGFKAGRASDPERAVIIRAWEACGQTVFAQRIEIGTEDIGTNVRWLQNYLNRIVRAEEYYNDPYQIAKKGETITIFVSVY